jgi:hypothetical protein
MKRMLKRDNFFIGLLSAFCALAGIACANKEKEKGTEKGSTSAALDPATLLEECEKADGRANADECYEKHAIKTQKPAFCDRIVGPRPKNICLQRSAAALGDAELCAKIDESTTRSGCRAEVAKKKGDAELCKKIEKPEAQVGCFRDVARAKKDMTICDLITFADTKGDCIGALATDKPDECEKLKEPAAKDKCYSRALTASEAPKDTEGRCDKIANPLLKNTCWSAIAARQDPLLCEKVVGPDAQHACYAAAISSSGDENTCPKIQKPETADICFNEIAIRKHDAKLCDKVKDAAKKKSCTEAVSKSGTAGDERIKKGIARTGPNEFTITREAADAMAKDQEVLSKSVRMVPEVNEGKTVGMKLFGIRADSVPAALGFENGDRVTKVNGFDVGSGDANIVQAKLAKADAVVVEVQRRGAPVTLTYTIK